MQCCALTRCNSPNASADDFQITIGASMPRNFAFLNTSANGVEIISAGFSDSRNGQPLSWVLSILKPTRVSWNRIGNIRSSDMIAISSMDQYRFEKIARYAEGRF